MVQQARECRDVDRVLVKSGFPVYDIVTILSHRKEGSPEGHLHNCTLEGHTSPCVLRLRTLLTLLNVSSLLTHRRLLISFSVAFDSARGFWYTS